MVQVPTQGCKFIDGDPGQTGWTYCGKELVGKGASWCEEHDDAVHVRSRKPRRNRALPIAVSHAMLPD